MLVVRDLIKSCKQAGGGCLYIRYQNTGHEVYFGCLEDVLKMFISCSVVTGFYFVTKAELVQKGILNYDYGLCVTIQ